LDRIQTLLSQLDPEQRVAVSHGEGPLLVVAGAGSGKTRVLTYRIAYLVAKGLAREHEVLAVTFTNKAAREMVERVEGLLGGRPRGGFVGTFHRFALQLLRNHPREAGLPQRFAIADEDDQRRTLEGVLKRLQIPSDRLTPRAARARISAAKNALQSPQQMAAAARFPEAILLADVFAAYQAELASAGAVDFDDMLLLSVRLLEREEAIRKGLADRFRWVLVDEYQDTNEAQARLLKLLTGTHPNLTVVGDEDQSIYRWRGAQVENILRFDHTYPGAKVVTLGRNYRSAEPILRAAAAVIANNTQRRPKKLSSEAGAGVPVTAYQAADESDEARFVAEEVERLRAEVRFGAMAVLFRINAQSRPFEAELVRRGVPYVVVAGTRFWERAEIKDAVAYLRLLVAPDDTLAFRRAVAVPPRGIGDATMELLEHAAGEGNVSLPAAACRLPATLTNRARLSLEKFFGLLDELRQLAPSHPADEVVSALLDRSGLAAMYSEASEEDRARRANLDELVTAAAEAAERGLDLAGFMDEVALVADADLRTSGEAVQLSTLHAAKGLEFDAVFLVGMEDGLLPLRREGADSLEDLEEERRLAYVGMTRAKKRLYLTSARVRRLHGKQMPGRLSPFFLEVPRDVVVDRTAAAGRDPFRASLPSPSGSFSGGWAPAPRATSHEPQPAVGRGTGPRSPEPGARSSHPDGWRPGLKVRHASFGSGVILQVQGTGAQTKLVVYFDRAGRKTLIPSLAKLERT
jgi:DNA helicase II / ATP-dependent DNA helicase PcrA